MRQCEKCGSQIGAEAAACPACGAVPSNAEPLPTAAKAKKFSLLLVAIAVCCGLVGVWFVYSFATRESNTAVTGPTSPPIDLSKVTAQAEGGNAEAQNSLGLAYAKGQQVTQDYAQAAKWYRKAADQGHAGAQASLGELCEAGQGMPRSDTEAAKWYRLAAEAGSTRGQYNLAVLYVMGRGVAHDEAEALKWYLRAAEQGESLAQYNVGMRYYEGHSVPPDPVEAYFWLNLAAGQGVPDAIKNRDALKRTMTSEQLAQARQRAEAFAARPPKSQTPAK